jgi:CheY-like chemotaxis protein
MRNYLIIDSNKGYAEKLYAALTNGAAHAGNNLIAATSAKDLEGLSLRVSKRVNRDTIILINTEAELEGSSCQDQRLVELAFWLRCKHSLKNVIVFYSSFSINHLLKNNPAHYILLSPGCYHLRLSLSSRELQKISRYTPLADHKAIKPYLKPRIALEKTRHRYANYAGMALMLNVAKQVWNIPVDSTILRGNVKSVAPFFSFRNSLDYSILATYFDLENGPEIKKTEEELYKIDSLVTRSKNILLIDDLAENGWKAILSRMIYGKARDKNLEALQVQTKVDKGVKVFDLDRARTDLDDAIKKHKPHLVLLDLRLNDEEGKKRLEDLGGYKLLQYLKSHSSFKGLPVIMFTASSSAESTKKLLAAGAEAVWTKPGLDEGLSAEEILERYASLIRSVKAAFSVDDADLKYLNDDEGNINRINFNSLRNKLLKKLEWVKYRCSLYKPVELAKKVPSNFQKYDAIYFDTNALITGNDRISFSDLISSFYLLAYLTSKSGLKIFTRIKTNTSGSFVRDNNGNYVWEGEQTISDLPKVVVMNVVYDEVIKLAKVKGLFDGDRSGVRSSIALLVLYELITDRLIRTELRNNQGVCSVDNPKENTYADGFILDEIGTILLTKEKLTKNKNKSFRFKDDCNVLFICQERGLSLKLNKLVGGTNFRVLNLPDFITFMSGVRM